MPDRLRSMEVFAKVAQLGSFSAAGRILGLSQTMVTKHVTALEEHLGAQLLKRSTKAVTPTQAGKRFARDCERILEEVRDAEALAASDRAEARGLLRMSVPLSFGIHEIAPILVDYERLHPHVQVELGLNDRVVDILDEGWDLAIRIGQLRDSSLRARRLAPCRMLVCASPGYLASHGTPRTVSDLTAHACLGYTLSDVTGPGQWAFSVDGSVKVAVSGPLRANNGDAVAAAAMAGLGIVYQPSFIVGDALRSGALVAVELDHAPIAMSAVHAVWPATRHPSAKVRTMIDFLAGRWSSTPPWDERLPAV